MDPYRITTEDGKKIVEMLRAFLAGEVPLDGFQAKLDEFRERFEEKLSIEERCYAADVSLELDLYEPNPDICSTDPLLHDEEGLRQSLKEFLELAAVQE